MSFITIKSYNNKPFIIYHEVNKKPRRISTEVFQHLRRDGVDVKETSHQKNDVKEYSISKLITEVKNNEIDRLKDVDVKKYSQQEQNTVVKNNELNEILIDTQKKENKRMK